MKWLVAMTVLALLVAATAFANVEIDVLSYNGLTMGEFLCDELEERGDDGDGREGHLGLLGSETSINFFFPALTKNIELGLNIDGGFDFDPANGGVGIILSAAPVVRYSFDEKNAVSLAGGLGFEGVFADSEPTFWGFTLTATYKRWLINKNGFHMGLCPGIGLAFPFGGEYTREKYFNHGEYYHYDLESGFGARLFFGLCFNFGDRSIDL